MFPDLTTPGPLDLGLTEAEVLEQLPAIARSVRDVPVPDWDMAWQALMARIRQEETRR
jgi:hypothetical protein